MIFNNDQTCSGIGTPPKTILLFMKKNTKKNLGLLWLRIDWATVGNLVAIQQKLIGEAKRNGNIPEMMRLQKSLVNSFEGRALAVRRVSTNQGRNTPGIDGKLLSDTASKWKMIEELRIVTQNLGSYQGSPVKRVCIPKPGKVEERPLGIHTLKDRCVQALILLALDPVVEETSDKCSFGFRRYRSAEMAIFVIFNIFTPRSRRGTELGPWSDKLWDAGIEKCFDRISHEFLLGELKMMFYDIRPIKSWLEAPIIDKGVSTGKNTVGTPQGGIISPVLANVALNGLEAAVHQSVGEKDRTGLHVVRYADDFIIAFRSDKQPRRFEPAIRAFLSERGLNISEKKSRYTTVTDGFNFLGWKVQMKPWNYRFNAPREKGKTWFSNVLVLTPIPEKVKDVKLKIKGIFSSTKNFQALIKLINPVLRGWCNYYASSYHSQVVFQSLGHYVYESVFRWLRKKHPTRGGKWIFANYNFPSKKRKWRLGISTNQVVFDPSTVVRRVLYRVKNNMNPYIEGDYWEDRKIITGYKGYRNEILGIWNGKCACCGCSLWGEEQVDFHHIIAQKDGGGHTLANVVPLHITCHQGITQRNLDTEGLWRPTFIPKRYKIILEKDD